MRRKHPTRHGVGFGEGKLAWRYRLRVEGWSWGVSDERVETGGFLIQVKAEILTDLFQFSLHFGDELSAVRAAVELLNVSSYAVLKEVRVGVEDFYEACRLFAKLCSHPKIFYAQAPQIAASFFSFRRELRLFCLTSYSFLQFIRIS